MFSLIITLTTLFVISAIVTVGYSTGQFFPNRVKDTNLEAVMSRSHLITFGLLVSVITTCVIGS